jgi:hypothetical protein
MSEPGFKDPVALNNTHLLDRFDCGDDFLNVHSRQFRPLACLRYLGALKECDIAPLETAFRVFTQN